MKRLFLFILVLLSFSLFSCASNKDSAYEENKDNESGSVVEEGTETVPNRKIIFTVEADLRTDDLESSVTFIKSNMNEDEWLDRETISGNYAKLVIRVKTEHLNTFLNAIRQNNEVSNFSKTAEDVSLKYQDKTNLLLTYQAERDRLLEIYENASLSDMITINQRIAEIDIEMSKIQGELNEFDSLTDYSTVTLNIYTTVEVEKQKTLSFGERVWNALEGGFNALVDFLEVIVIVIVAILPWMIVIVPAGYLIYRIRKSHKRKNIKPHNKDNNQ